MARCATIWAAALLGTATAMNMGCAQSASTVETASNPPTVPPLSDPMTRAGQVASVSGRAQKCGLVFDAPKLKSSFLNYETALGASAPQLATIEKTYDTTYEAIIAPTNGPPTVCSPKERTEVQSQLQRYMVGYFTPRKNIATSPSDADDKFDPSKFWKQQDALGKARR